MYKTIVILSDIKGNVGFVKKEGIWVTLPNIKISTNYLNPNKVERELYKKYKVITNASIEELELIEVNKPLLLIRAKIIFEEEKNKIIWIEREELTKYRMDYAARLVIDSEKGITEQVFYRKAYLVNKALIQNRKTGKFLLLKRSKKSSLEGGKWDLPGGKIEKWEILEQNLKHRIFEETGLSVNLKTVANFTLTQIATTGKYKGETFLNTLSIALTDEETIRAKKEKFVDYKWVDFEELIRQDWAYYIKYLIFNFIYTYETDKS